MCSEPVPQESQDAAGKEAPLLRPVGLSGLLVTFGDRLSDRANRSALAFRAAVDDLDQKGIRETATTLTSTFISYDPKAIGLTDLRDLVSDLMQGRDWADEGLPTGRRLWRIPTSFGGKDGPQLGEAAGLAGLTESEAIAEIEATRLRILAIGFAPGMPYLGTLPEHWDMPRQTALSRRAPWGAVVTAIRQLNIFTGPTPTGWRQIGQTAFRNFRIEEAEPFALRSGDEVQLVSVTAAEIDRLRDARGSDIGGAVCEYLP